jgi:hypothetical protein
MDQEPELTCSHIPATVAMVSPWDCPRLNH